MFDIIKSIPKAFFSPAFYWDVVRRWRGIGIGFILFIALLDFTHSAVSLFIPIQKIIVAVPEFVDHLPVATIKDHHLSIDQPTPYLINFNMPTKALKATTQAENLSIVIDTNYTINDLESLKNKMLEEKILILFTSTQMISFKVDTKEIRIEDLSSLPDTVVTHERWVNFGKAFMVWMPICLAFLVALGSLIGNFIGVLVFSIVALLVGVFSKSIPDFGSAMRLAAAAAIPGSIIFILAPYSFVIKTLIWCGYIIFGAWCARKQPV